MLRTYAIRLHASFLLVMGSAGVIADLASYFAGAGPWGTFLQGEFTAIGFTEAHGLAALVGAAGLYAAAHQPKVFWNLQFLGAGLLLGIANLVFYEIFRSTGQDVMGVVTTSGHFAFAALHATAMALGSVRSTRTA